MNEDQFILKNKEKWVALEAYNNRLSPKSLSIKNLSIKSVTALDSEEIKNYAGLYRAAGYHLTYARTHFQNSKTALYLNELVGTSHNHFFIKEKTRLFDALDYLKRDFPVVVRRCQPYIYAAFLCFLLGFLFSFILVAMNEQNIHYFYSGVLTANTQLDASGITWNYSLMSSLIMTNNLRVALFAVALGISAGVGTIYVLFMNGMMMGGLTSYMILQDASMLSFWSLILPHGFLELGAIFICGGAGLMIGHGLLIPGILRRKDSLVLRAKVAVRLLPGAALMLVVAGLIEGFLTPAPVGAAVKIAFSFITLFLIILYVRFAGHTNTG